MTRIEKAAALGSLVLLPMPDGEYLLQRNSKGDFNAGKLRPPGGHKEESDADMRATAIRELKEEFDIDVKAEDLKFLGYDPRDKFWGNAVFRLDKHRLKPGKYQASNSPDEVVVLEAAAMDDEDYAGPDVTKLLSEDEKAAGDKAGKGDLVSKRAMLTGTEGLCQPVGMTFDFRALAKQAQTSGLPPINPPTVPPITAAPAASSVAKAPPAAPAAKAPPPAWAVPKFKPWVAPPLDESMVTPDRTSWDLDEESVKAGWEPVPSGNGLVFNPLNQQFYGPQTGKHSGLGFVDASQASGFRLPEPRVAKDSWMAGADNFQAASDHFDQFRRNYLAQQAAAAAGAPAAQAGDVSAQAAPQAMPAATAAEPPVQVPQAAPPAIPAAPVAPARQVASPEEQQRQIRAALTAGEDDPSRYNALNAVADNIAAGRGFNRDDITNLTPKGASAVDQTLPLLSSTPMTRHTTESYLEQTKQAKAFMAGVGNLTSGLARQGKNLWRGATPSTVAAEKSMLGAVPGAPDKNMTGTFSSLLSKYPGVAAAAAGGAGVAGGGYVGHGAGKVTGMRDGISQGAMQAASAMDNQGWWQKIMAMLQSLFNDKFYQGEASKQLTANGLKVPTSAPKAASLPLLVHGAVVIKKIGC